MRSRSASHSIVTSGAELWNESLISLAIRIHDLLMISTELGNETGKFQKLKKSTHEFFICLWVINEKHMNSHFVLCQFENLF